MEGVVAAGTGLQARTLVMDNGSGHIKAGFVGDPSPRVITNAIMKPKRARRSYIGAQLETECKDRSSIFFKRPFEQGFPTKLDTQKEIWEHAFGKDMLNVASPGECNLILTEPLFNFPDLREPLDELVFEDFGFASYCRTTAPYLAAFAARCRKPAPCQLIVDTGFAFSHVVPVFDGRVVLDGVRRVDVGGKVLTNYLKELLSYRHVDLTGETYVVNEVKEDTSFVSMDFAGDLAAASSSSSSSSTSHLVQYALPDFDTLHRGHRVTKEKPAPKGLQTLSFAVERFAVPELLFNPVEAGIPQRGLVDIAADAVAACHPDLEASLLDNILVCGGNAAIPNFAERLQRDLRASSSIDVSGVNVFRPDEPAVFSWHGGVALAQQPVFRKHVVTKAEYNERGADACRRTFGSFYTESSVPKPRP